MFIYQVIIFLENTEIGVAEALPSTLMTCLTTNGVMRSVMIVMNVFRLRLHSSPIFFRAIHNPNGKNAEFSGKISVMLSNASMGEKEIVVLGDFKCDYFPNVNSKEVII